MAEEVPKGPNEDLPVINDWRTKSFWLIVIIPGALVISNMLGFNLLEFFGVTTAAELADKVYMVVILVLGIAGLIARAAPQARLKFLGSIGGANPNSAPTVKSHWLIGAIVIGSMLALSGCSGVSEAITKYTKLTEAEQLCLAQQIPAVVKENGEGWGHLTNVEKGKVVQESVRYLTSPEVCNIQNADLQAIDLMVSTAMQTFFDGTKE